MDMQSPNVLQELLKDLSYKYVITSLANDRLETENADLRRRLDVATRGVTFTEPTRPAPNGAELTSPQPRASVSHHVAEPAARQG